MDEDKAKGCLYGQLIGDSLGSRYEFRESNWVKKAIEEDKDSDGFLPILGGGPCHTRPGEGTDDSEMAFSLAASMCRKGHLDAADVALAYVAWLQSNPLDIGKATLTALNVPGVSVDRTKETSKSVKTAVYKKVIENVRTFNIASMSNGCLMRISPLAVSASKFSLQQLRKMVEADVSLTHCNPVAYDGVYIYCVAIRALLRGRTPEEAFGEAYSNCINPTVRLFLNTARTRAVPVQVGDELVNGDAQYQGYIGVALQSAFYELIHANSFYEGLVNAIARGGDTDTNGCIVGALLGARFGVSSIPHQWLSDVKAAAYDVRCPRLGLCYHIDEILPKLLNITDEIHP
ncbi:hypothetical protein AB6A40_005757 [Gnathostoma spinigerum]|uniref:ADP-ribosylhydrolase ARH3 n=1 Tax=Gnathostoma spinigerum TaxID=75299 RepID=A0ABD6EPW9_9BILA